MQDIDQLFDQRVIRINSGWRIVPSRCSIDLIPLLAMICYPQCALRRERAGTSSRDQATQISQRCCFDDVGPDTCSKFIEELLRQASYLC